MSKDSGQSTRIMTRKHFTQVTDHLRQANLRLCEIHKLYAAPHPVIGEACKKCVDIISMVEAMIYELRSQI